MAAVPAPQVAVQPPDHQVRPAAPLQSAGEDRHRYNMGKPGSSHFRDPPLISEETPLKSEAVLIKYLDFWHCYCIENSRYICVAII